MDQLKNRTEAEAVAEVVQKFYTPQILRISEADIDDAATVWAVPAGMRLESAKPFIDALRQAPERRKGTAKLTELASFIAHANRFKDTHSALFANPDPQAPRLVSVLDYHQQGAGSPRFGEHRGEYAFPVSDEWKAWSGIDGRAMGQADFAAFLEDRIADIADPTSASSASLAFAQRLGVECATASRLLELSKGLSLRVGQKVTERHNLDSGETVIQFEQEHQDKSGGPLKVPSAFLLGIPVFRMGERFLVPARLRYRIGSGAVQWFVSLYRADITFNTAFTEACEDAQKKTELPLFYGSAENG